MEKNVEKKKEPHHTDNMKMVDLDTIIKEFMSEDEVKNNNERRKEEIKSLKIKNNKIAINKSDETSYDSDVEKEKHSCYEESDSDHASSFDGISEDEEEHEDWMKRKVKWKERSNCE